MNPIKIISYGSSGVGNNSYSKRLVKNKFKSDVRCIIGVKFRPYNVEINGEEIKTRLWSTAGQERFRAIGMAHARNSMGIILSYDISDQRSFDEIPSLLRQLRELCDANTVFMLIGMKIDRYYYRVVTTEEGAQFAKKEGLLFAETSSKLNINIHESFTNLIIEIYNRQKSTNIPKLKYIEQIPLSSQQLKNQNVTVIKQENDYLDDTNFFYNNVLYPFNFELFKNHSQYLERNQNIFKDKNIINLINEFETKPNISPESIQTLIKFCKNEKVNIDVLNMNDLFILSNIYEIQELQARIRNFIFFESQDITKQFLSTNNGTNLSYYHENLIAENLVFFIRYYEEQIILLPFHSIYRILQKYSMKEQQNENNSKVNGFLIKVIKIHGIQIFHLLFELKFIKINSEIINELSNLCLTGSDMNYMDPNLFLIISEMNKEFKKIQTEVNTLQTEVNSLQTKVDFQKNIIYSNSSSIQIPPSITNIDDNYFEGHEQLKQIIFSELLINIGKYSFARCSMITQITIPASVVNIGSGCFSDCKSLYKVNILAQLTSIESHLFENCISLKKIEIPSSVEVIDDESFSGCISLKQVLFKNNNSELKKIGIRAFMNCHSLTKINISQYSHEIGMNAFEGCYLLDLNKFLKHVNYNGRRY